MIEKVRGDLVVHPGQRYALVVASFNDFITSRLAAAAVDALLRHGATPSQIVEFSVSGAFEVPTLAGALARSGKYAAIICLACVIRGQTGHYDHVSDQISRGIGQIGPSTGVPTLFGVVTTENQEQAIDRAGLKAGNAGWNAACTAIEMANLMAKIQQ